MLPVFERGSLLFFGDGHARQGHGEVVGNVLEISMNVKFSVDLVKGKTISLPRLETDRYIMVLGSARPLLQALQHATTELQCWLLAGYDFDERGASIRTYPKLGNVPRSAMDQYWIRRIARLFRGR